MKRKLGKAAVIASTLALSVGLLSGCGSSGASTAVATKVIRELLMTMS